MLRELSDGRFAIHSSARVVVGREGDTCGAAEISLQLRVLRHSFFQDGDVGVGVFPERQEFYEVATVEMICRWSLARAARATAMSPSA